MSLDVKSWKIAAAREAAGLVKDGMVVGLGSGTTMVELVKNLSKRKIKGVIFVPASVMIEKAAKRVGLKLGTLGDHDELDLTIDGADEVDQNFNMIKGHGGAHAREKIIAKAARRVVIVVDSTKLVRKLGERFPVPVEVLPFSASFIENDLIRLGGHPKLRKEGAKKTYVTDNGNYILDVKFHRIQNPAKLECEINCLPGVIENGIFVGLTDAVIVGHEGGVTTIRSKRDFLKRI